MAKAKPDGAYQTSGTIKPADTVDSNICIKACPEAAVPRIFGWRSNAAKESMGIASAMPILNKATGAML